MTGAQSQEPVKVKGKWRIVIRDAKTEEVIKEWEQENVITKLGKEFFARMVATPCYSNKHGRCNWVMLLGTGNQTPSEDDTGLFEPVPSTGKKGQLTYSNNSVQYYVRYMPEEANGYTYTEVGIYDGIAKWGEGNNPFDPTQDYTLGKLINHLLINPPIQKTSDILVDIYVVITFL